MEQQQLLLEVLKNYGVPDPQIVGKLPKGGTSLDFVGHADITKILISVDPLWRWVPIAWNEGRPAIHVENGMATMWGELTLLGHSRLGVGSVRADKPDLDKELVSDFLRNGAMRFGICLSLWTKQEWDDQSWKSKDVTTSRSTGGEQQRTFTKPASAEHHNDYLEKVKVGSAAKPAETEKKTDLTKTVQVILEKFDESTLVVNGPGFDERMVIAATWGAWPLVKGISGLAARSLGMDPPGKLVEICNKEVLWNEVKRLIDLRKSPK